MLNQKPMARPRPRFGPFERRLEMRARLDRFQHFGAADAAVLGAVHQARALARRILEPELDRIQAELLGQFIHHGFRSEGGIGGSRRAVGGRVGLVHHHVIAIHRDVFERVAGEDAHRAGHDHRARETAGFVKEVGFGRGEPAVTGGPHLHADVRARSGPGRLEDVAARHHHLHRTPRFLRKQRGERLQVHPELAAEAAADLHRIHFDPRNRQVQRSRHGIAHAERALRARPDLDPAVARPECRGVVRLDIALVHGGGVELALDDDIGLGEALGRVAQRPAEVLGHVADAVRQRAVHLGLQVIVQERRTRSHRVGRGEHGGQHFVIHADQRRGFLGDVRRSSGDGSHGVAAIDRLLIRQNVGADEAQQRLAFAQIEPAIRRIRHIGEGDHGLHARERLGGAGIELQNARVRVRAAQHEAVQHAGHLHVGPVQRAAGHLIGPVGPHRAGSDDVVVSGAHACASFMAAAAL